MNLSARVRKRMPQFTLDVDIACPAGSIMALTGPSGSGKTTILRILAGLEEFDTGRVCLGDAIWCDTRTGVKLTPQQRGIGLVFQEYSLFPHMTLAENVAYATTDKSFASELLELFGIAQLAKSRPCRMSGGERQRGALCQALARHPKALLLDEPFSALDAANRVALRKVLLMVRDRFAVPIVHVTHDLAEAAMLGDQVLALRHGVLDQDWFARQIRQCQEEQRALIKRFGPITPSVDNPITFGGIA